ncbi:MAG: DUF2442 domain-containing protein [Synechocystis sp.]|nr:DUF2442 domain-containing protein [Synechocystis sp.]
MQYPKIVSVKILEKYVLLVHFSDHQIKKYNCEKLLENTMFTPLKDYAFFKNFHVDSSGSGIVWNDDLDISEYEIWVNGVDASVYA